MQQREISFRAWDKNGKRMLNDSMSIAAYIWMQGMPFVDVEWMQFTGLLDKNGKKIFEGDIIIHTNKEADHKPYAVPEMTPEGMGVIAAIGDGEWDVGNGQYSNIEIIGNTYENPELLPHD